MTLKIPSRADDKEETFEVVTHNFREIAGHSIELPDNPTLEQLAEAVRQLLALLKGTP